MKAQLHPMSTKNITDGIHHLGLTVLDLSRTKDFFVDVLGFQLLAEKPDYPSAFLTDGKVMITLWQVQQPESALPFDRKKVLGLHHFALRLESTHQLDAVHERLLQEPEVEIEFAPEGLHGGPTRHLMCTIPGGLRMELIAVAA